MMKKIILLSALVLSGCSTTPVSPDLAKEVAVASAFKMRSGSVPVTIVRDKGIVAGACAITSFINGEQIANLNTGEKVVAYVEPGTVIVGAGFTGSGFCKGPAKREREFTVDMGKPKALRIFIDQNANVDILPTTEH
ncbi:hypothetical protein ACP3TC_07680 [Winslowiella sp. 2C04]|uniref:hypothetical protein n=1 Tax=Winslowiella sp. 2C04 TaxID=3416179 RepID=UPI003CFABD72